MLTKIRNFLQPHKNPDADSNHPSKPLNPLWGVLFLIVGVLLAIVLAKYTLGTETATPTERSQIIATILGGMPGLVVAVGGVIGVVFAREASKVKATQQDAEVIKQDAEVIKHDTAEMKEDVVRAAKVVTQFAAEMGLMRIQLLDSHDLLEETRQAFERTKRQNTELMAKIDHLQELNEQYTRQLEEANVRSKEEKKALTAQIRELQEQVDELLRKVAEMEGRA